MELTAVRTGSGIFRVHRAGCDDIAKDAAQARGSARDLDAESREAVIRLLWADVLGDGGAPGAFQSCAGRTDFIGCTWGLPATSQA
ncbi:MAG: hypothetical protein ABSB01_00815 [Streptosporangiaceae bacterium]|jgi:hypothetical protein